MNLLLLIIKGDIKFSIIDILDNYIGGTSRKC